VSHEDFLDELQPLVEWKNRTGMPTIIVSWQSLDRGYMGFDEPERIKRGIADFQQRFGIQYVMLVGDCHNFPLRYEITDSYVNETSVSFGCYFACDLYYADLYDESGNFDSWDYNGDRYYGEMRGSHYHDPINYDRINMIPDVAVGRVPASDEAEVTTYVNKVINYESRLVTESWVSNILFVVTTDDFPSWYPTKEDIIERYSGVTFLHNKPPPTFWRMYTTDVSSTADYEANWTNMIYAMNTYGYGLINFCGHGWQADEAVEPNYHCGMDSGIGTYHMVNLTTNRYSIVFSTGCGLGRFTVEPPGNAYVCEAGVQHRGANLGEVFFPPGSTPTYAPRPAPLQPRIPPYCVGEIDSFGEYGLVRTQVDAHGTLHVGAFMAFIGCITGAQEPAGELDKYFLEAFFSSSGLEKRVGDLWKYMVERYCDEHGYGRGEHSKTAGDWFDVAKYDQPLKFPLFGDPSLRVGGLPHQPPQIETVHLPIPSFPEGTTVDFSPYISFYDPEGETLQYRIDSDGDSHWDTVWRSSLTYTYRDNFYGSCRIQASDGEYLSEIVTLSSINIYNVQPSPEIEIPAAPIYYDYSNWYRFLSGDPGDDTFTYIVDFGDGSPDVERTSIDKSILISHTYFSQGEYTIHATVADDNGEVGSTSINVHVGMPDPATETARRIVQRLGGGKPEIGFLIFGTLITIPAAFAVTAWIKIPKWWRPDPPVSARLIISLLPMLMVIGSLIILRIVPLLELLGFH
jgi:hypothetical protein